ncbi:hypothetical protein JWG42_04085 [Desulfoprunum benzoelyticum]|uniref:D-arabinose 1-dehydrogenase-like Zn-dependent alcohol dehydrogenase n=1 Tax=Desulfoprunum benzoelyticum TaxID=1506996 RepID=A0A840UYK6_9BACT|nr:hypothetical protein [Desulfoprunum benzoelyticum]MBB5347738.1 D-arabinose 1-dehydrogenase-like Zn-dependent alcohol dehydrogenase [Desulfoprunum benzoelyticum]MBM9529329.1 hypothetical protein [Desulfoprunum benzoelyticum]
MKGLIKNQQAAGSIAQFTTTIKGDDMKKGEKLVIVGCSGSGGPAAMMAKKLMPEIDVTIIRKEEFFIVR